MIIEVQPEANPAVPHAEVLAGRSVSQFVKERRTQHEGKQTYYQIDIYLVVEQQKVGCTEEELSIQECRYKR